MQSFPLVHSNDKMIIYNADSLSSTKNVPDKITSVMMQVLLQMYFVSELTVAESVVRFLGFAIKSYAT